MASTVLAHDEFSGHKRKSYLIRNGTSDVSRRARAVSPGPEPPAKRLSSRAGARIGEQWQASVPLEPLFSRRGLKCPRQHPTPHRTPSAAEAPPTCWCGLPAICRRGRFWCAGQIADADPTATNPAAACSADESPSAAACARVVLGSAYAPSNDTPRDIASIADTRMAACTNVSSHIASAPSIADAPHLPGINPPTLLASGDATTPLVDNHPAAAPRGINQLPLAQCTFEWVPPPPPYVAPQCTCGHPATWFRGRFMCSRRPAEAACGFKLFLHTPTPAELRVNPSSVAEDLVRPMCTLLTASAFGPVNPWCFVAPCDCGLGLFARADLLPNQVVSEYGGPRLPQKLAQKGVYVLVANKETVIDGNGENSPFEYAVYPAIYANHSATLPNARLEAWPAEDGHLGPAERLVLVASRCVSRGQEIRFNYEGGHSSYWREDTRPQERGEWQRAIIETPPPTPEEPVIAPPVGSSGKPFSDLERLAPDEEVMPWAGLAGGDARLRKLMGMLDPQGKVSAAKPGRSVWRVVCTHLPGRTGVECRDRWLLLCRMRDASGGTKPGMGKEVARPAGGQGEKAAGPVMGQHTGTAGAAQEAFPACMGTALRVPHLEARPEDVIQAPAAQLVSSLPEGGDEHMEGDSEVSAEETDTEVEVEVDVEFDVRVEQPPEAPLQVSVTIAAAVQNPVEAYLLDDCRGAAAQRVQSQPCE